MKIIGLIFLMLWASYGIASERVNCDQVWKNHGSIVQVESPVFANPLMPGDGVVEGFTIKILKQENGKLFHPKTLGESVCAIDIMLDAKTRDAIRLGVKDYLTSQLFGSSEENIDNLWYLIDKRLDILYADSGMTLGLGINLILGLLEEQFDIRLFGGAKNYGVLQKQAAKNRIHSPNSVLLWVWYTYLEHLDIKGFDSSSFVAHLKMQNAEE